MVAVVVRLCGCAVFDCAQTYGEREFQISAEVVERVRLFLKRTISLKTYQKFIRLQKALFALFYVVR